MSESTPQYPPLPPDDLQRTLTLARPDTDQTLPHIGLVGDTYTITVSGEETADRFSVIDMHIPPGGGPAPHRHDFEETFILLEGEIEATFRGKSPSRVPAIPSTYLPTHHTSFTTLRRNPHACFVSARPPDRKNSSKKWVTNIARVDRRRRGEAQISAHKQGAFCLRKSRLPP